MPMNGMRDERGQTSILIAMGLSTVMLTGALFALQLGSEDSTRAIRTIQRSEIRTALSGAIETVARIYHDSNCDPVVLNQKLSRLNADGSLLPVSSNGITPEGGTYTNRLLTIEVNNKSYTVSIGAVVRLEWEGTDPSLGAAQDTTGSSAVSHSFSPPGTSQDAVVEVWTSSGTTRVVQRAVLLNTCTYPCSYTDTTDGAGSCIVDSDDAIAYHKVTALSFPTVADRIDICYGGRRFGDLNAEECDPKYDPDGTVDMSDVQILRNYLRSGSLNGTCSSFMQPATGNSCADLNKDGLVNEIDLGIMEKLLRGYALKIPTRE